MNEAIRSRYRRLRGELRRRIERRLYHFGPTDLAEALKRLGVCEGMALMVHSSHARFTAFEGKATDVIAVLEKTLGEQGTVLMPTLPFGGSAVEYARKAPIFNAARTPSRMGLFSEIFRRMPGVVRSLHPTHSVAMKGRLASKLGEGHHLAETPCGLGSPFAKLLDVDGWILLLGVGIRSMTFFHTIEALLEPRMPFSPFTEERFTLRCEVEDKIIDVGPMRLYDPAVGRRWQTAMLEPPLCDCGQWRTGRAGNVSLILLRAREVYAAAEWLADRGIYCYDAAHPSQ